MKSLQQIEADVAALGQRIGASVDDLTTYGTTRDFGYPHVEVAGNQYHYVIAERGNELSRQSTFDYDELLYWIFSNATHNLAFSHELRNRIEEQDCRRVAFPKQVELMTLISPYLAARLANDINEVLRRYPYDDEPTRAVNRIRRDRAT